MNVYANSYFYGIAAYAEIKELTFVYESKAKKYSSLFNFYPIYVLTIIQNVDMNSYFYGTNSRNGTIEDVESRIPRNLQLAT